MITSSFEKLEYTRNLLATDASMYFRHFMRRLHNVVVPNSKQLNGHPMLIMFPEISQNRHLHYHGFLLISKSNIQKFLQKAVIQEQAVPILSMDVEKMHHILHEKVINPYPGKWEVPVTQWDNDEKYTTIGKSILNVQSYRLHRLDYHFEMLKTFNYSVKDFRESRFSEEDVIVERKHISTVGNKINFLKPEK